jgi:ParB family chromosome partitioning protein
VGLNRSTVANHIRLLELPETIQQAVSDGTLSMGHAKALLALQDRQRLVDLANDAVSRSLSVREVERLVREASRGPREETSGAADGEQEPQEATLVPQAPWVRELESRMQEYLGSKVRLKNGENYRGQIVIDYFGREDLERLIGKLTETTTL